MTTVWCYMLNPMCSSCLTVYSSAPSKHFNPFCCLSKVFCKTHWDFLMKIWKCFHDIQQKKSQPNTFQFPSALFCNKNWATGSILTTSPGDRMWLLVFTEAVGHRQSHVRVCRCILTANQHDGSGHVETFAFFQGEQLDNEQDECHNGENDREDHKGLHGFEGSCQNTKNRWEKVRTQSWQCSSMSCDSPGRKCGCNSPSS